MGDAKYPLAVVVSLVLATGLLCSQICYFDCALNGCSISSPIRMPEESGEHSHCHQQKQNPKPQNRNSSRECPGHFEAVAVPASFVTSTHFIQHPDSMVSPIIGPSLSLDSSPVEALIKTGQTPDRSPPIHSVLRI